MQREQEGHLPSDASALCVTAAESHFAFLGLGFLQRKMLVKVKRAEAGRQLPARSWCPRRGTVCVTPDGETRSGGQVDCPGPAAGLARARSQSPLAGAPFLCTPMRTRSCWAPGSPRCCLPALSLEKEFPCPQHLLPVQQPSQPPFIC